MSLLDGLARQLDQAGHGTYNADGTPYTDEQVGICLDVEQQHPPQTVTLISYPGAEADSKEPLDEPRVNVRVRGAPDPRVGRARAQAIYGELHGLGSLHLPDGTWLHLAFGVQSGPEFIGQDNNGRTIHVCNFRTLIHNPTPHRT